MKEIKDLRRNMRLATLDKIEDAVGWASMGLYYSGAAIGLAAIPTHITGRISTNPNINHYADALLKTGLESLLIGYVICASLILYEGTR